MNVLITGGYGFIGSFVAERFHKEGHQVVIIDNLSTGQRANVQIPHKFYQLDVEDKQCSEVFRSIAPDVVVHLAAQINVVNSIKQPQDDTQVNIVGLVNMLTCAQQSGVNKFIFASSAAVYGPQEAVSLSEETDCSPVSPYGINKKLGEYYCGKWQELYGLNTLSFRFSNVFGPRQGSVGEGGVVSIFMERLRDGKPFQVYGDGEQTRDFIYVEDVVDAIYRGATSDITGVYNLSTNTETSVNQLIEILGTYKDINQVAYHAAREGDIARSSLDNTRIKRDLDWISIHSLQEGLARTYEWFAKSNSTEKKKKSDEEVTVKKITRWTSLRPFVENLALFLVLTCIYVFRSDLLFHTNVDFKLIYIIILGIFYGSKQSVLSAVLASGLYFYESIANGREWISLFYDPEVLFAIAIYIFFGLVVGFASDKRRRDHGTIENELNEFKEKHEFLKTVYQDTRDVKNNLQRQLINSKDSIGRIYSIIKKLESLEPEQIVNSSIKVLSELIDSEQISIYSVGKSKFLRLMMKSKHNSFNPPKSIRLSDHPHIQEVIASGKMFVNKSLDAAVPMLISPISHNGEVVAIVSVHDVEFIKLNTEFQNLLKVSTDLISDSLSRAFQFVGATRSERYMEGTEILKPALFTKMIESKAIAKDQNNADYVLLAVEDGGMGAKSISERISSVLRNSDYMGMLRNSIAVLLSNSNQSEAELVRQRLEQSGISTRILHEDEAYG